MSLSNLDSTPESNDFETLFGEPEPVATPAGGEPVVDPAAAPATEPDPDPQVPSPEGDPSPEGFPAGEGRDASRLQSELDMLKEKTKDYDNLQQLLAVVTSNPALNEAVRLAVAGLDPTQAFAKAKEVVAEAKVEEWKSSIPDPVKPADFDEFAAINDPNSASYRYRAAVEEKRIQDAIDRRIAAAEARQAQTFAQREAEAQRKQAQQQAWQIMDQAVVASGLQDKAADFRTWVTTELPKATPEHLLTMYKAVRGIGAPATPPVPPEVGKKQNELARQREAAEKAAAQGAIVPGAPVETEKDEFFPGYGTALASLYA